MNTVEEVKEYSKGMELHGVAFLDKRGEFALDRSNCVKIDFEFIDGKILTLPYEEAEKLNNHQFRLRKNRDDA